MLDDRTTPPRTYFPTPRDELIDRLRAGDEALHAVMHGSVRTLRQDHVVVHADQHHEVIYRLISGKMARLRILDDGRRQIISIFTPGDLVAIKAMLLYRQPDSIVCLSHCTVQTLDYTSGIALASENSDVSFRLAACGRRAAFE